MKSIDFKSLLICLAIPLSAGATAGFATATSIDSWYARLNKPSFNPPNYLFGPVWTILYILMGISLYIIWKAPKNKFRNHALWVFGIQLILNFSWSFIFFKYKEINLALIEIIFVWLSVLTMIIVFWKVKKNASYLQLPYLLWVSFATILNFAIWKLN